MRKPLSIAGIVAVVALLAIGVYTWGPATPPSGQAPLLELTSENLQQFQSAFNESADQVRVVALLSPT